MVPDGRARGAGAALVRARPAHRVRARSRVTRSHPPRRAPLARPRPGMATAGRHRVRRGPPRLRRPGGDVDHAAAPRPLSGAPPRGLGALLGVVGGEAPRRGDPRRRGGEGGHAGVDDALGAARRGRPPLPDARPPRRARRGAVRHPAADRPHDAARGGAGAPGRVRGAPAGRGDVSDLAGWLPRAAAERPRPLAVRAPDGTLTYEELLGAARRADPPPVLDAAPSLRFVVLLHAALLRGTPVLPADPRWSAAEREERLAVEPAGALTL